MDRRNDSHPDFRPTDDAPTPAVSVLAAEQAALLARLEAEAFRPTEPPRADTPPVGATPTLFYPHLPRYQLLEPAGRGGMGQVVRARDLTLGREVAVKFLLRPHDAPPGLVERFKREAVILAQLDHPHVMPIYDSGEANGFLYYVMKLVPGGSLARQSAVVRTSARRVAELVRKVALAVQHVHQKGVLHRDLKPGNILVDDRGEPVVVDFGIARWDDGHTATTGLAVFGTPQYLAPEVARGGSHAGDDRSDVWSLGVILYELLAGERPFATDRGDLDLFRRILVDAPAPLAAAPHPLPDADDQLEAVCLKCLAKNPADRHPSAQELADALQRWLDGKPVGVTLAAARKAATGKEAAPAPRPKRWWPRAAATVAAMGAAVALLLAPVPWKRGGRKEPRKPLAERLAKPGDSVVFVDETGRLLERADGEVPGFEGEGVLKAAGPDGYCELKATDEYLLELGNEPLPFPVVLEAEVRRSGSVRAGAVYGVYTARGVHPQPRGELLHFAFVNEFRATGQPEVPGMGPDRMGAIARIVRIAPMNRTGARYVPMRGQPVPVPDAPAGVRFAAVEAIAAAAGPTVFPAIQYAPRPPAVGAFHTLVIEAGGQFRSRCDLHTFKLLDRAWEQYHVRWSQERNGERFAGPLLGDGFGLIVAHGSCQYRNVRLTRLAE